MENLKKALRDMKQETESQLKKAVITDIITDRNNEDIESYIKDVINYGCISGISSLIYYKDTEKFFIKFNSEIFDLLNDYKEENGEYPNIELNSNNLAWFGYETICQQLLNELEIEY
jgi:hypothetical protein